jgi:hypothetical protein
LYRKIKKNLTDALLNQQIGEKIRHYSHLHLAGEVRYWKLGRDWYDIEEGQLWKLVDFEDRLSNLTSTGREFLNSAEKLLVVDLVDWLKNGDKIGGTLRLKRKAKSKMSTYPNFVEV